MMSEPMEFWRLMECSGVSSMGVPSWGDRKRTPSSVMVASVRRDTIWKLGRQQRLKKGPGNVPAAVGEEVVAPALQLVGAPHGVEDVLARLEAEVVGVVEAKAAAGALQLLRREALERGLGGNGHEHGQVDGAVGERHDGRPGPSCLDN